MKMILAIGLILASLPAMAAHPIAYAPAWGGRDVAVQARHLDDAAQRLYHDLRFNSYRSDLRSRARDLARATHDFRYLAERRAAYSKLAAAFRRVEQREDALARRLYDSRGYDGYGRQPAGLRQLRHAMQRVDQALQRYAYDGRDHRYRGSFVYVPSYSFWYGYGARHDHRYDPRGPQRDDRRHDRRDDPRHDRRDNDRDDRRDDRREERRDGQRQDQQQDQPAERREERRDDRRPTGRTSGATSGARHVPLTGPTTRAGAMFAGSVTRTCRCRSPEDWTRRPRQALAMLRPAPGPPARARGNSVNRAHRAAAMLLFCLAAAAQGGVSTPDLDAQARAIEPRLIEWRRDFHRHPELGNREFRTSKIIAAHLESLGLEVHTGIAHTGVAAVLRGGRPGPVIALRADMDALPVTEQVDLPFRSTVTTEYRGQQTGVMHACGHDGHTAILMAAAEVLATNRDELPGTVLFIFQPAEEGAPEGEQGGASLMLAEGLFDIVQPEAAFGLHLHSGLQTGMVGYRPGPFMASSDFFRIVVKGKQSHGAQPWDGVDPIVIAAQIINGLQTIVSRQLDITEIPAIVTIGSIQGGIRHNIIPDEVEMLGTFRTFRPEVRAQVMARIAATAEHIARAGGASAEIAWGDTPTPAVINDVALTRRMVPALERAAPGKVRAIGLKTVAEDFSVYAQRVPSLFFWVGVTPPGTSVVTAPSNHSPLFYMDEDALVVGLKAMLSVAVDYLERGPAPGEVQDTQ